MTPNNHWGVTAALGIARIVHKLDDNYGFEKVDGITACLPAPEGVEYQKSWLRYWAFIAAGPEVEWRVGIKSRAKYNGGKHTLSDKLNTHPLGVNLLLQAGYGCFGFNARFALTSLFEKGNAPELYPASVGFGWYW